MKKNIVILDGYVTNPGDLSWEKIASLGNLTVYDRTEPEDTFERIKDAEFIFTNKTLLPNDILSKCTNLKWIGVLATGYNVLDVSFAREKGIHVTNIPAYSTDSVAQHVFALLLNTTNFVSPYSHLTSNGSWTKSEDFCMTTYRLRELAKKNFGLIGFGTIGKAVSQIAIAFGMKVLVYTPNPKIELETDSLKFVSMDEVFKNSDVLSLHCLLNENTRGIVNKEKLSLMKKESIIINTARGPLIVDEDLADALDKGLIHAACLDVLSLEPPESSNPLLNAKNCTVTPHIAWNSLEARSRLIDIAYENLRSYLEDDTLKNCVN